MIIYALNAKEGKCSTDAHICNVRIGNERDYHEALVFGKTVNQMQATVKRDINNGTARGAEYVAIAEEGKISGVVYVPYDFIHGMNFAEAYFLYEENGEKKVLPIPNYNERYLIGESTDTDTETDTDTDTAN